MNYIRGVVLRDDILDNSIYLREMTRTWFVDSRIQLVTHVNNIDRQKVSMIDDNCDLF
jgi:hypothetical protein